MGAGINESNRERYDQINELMIALDAALSLNVGMDLKFKLTIDKLKLAIQTANDDRSASEGNSLKFQKSLKNK